MQANQGICHPLTESLDTTDDVDLHILHMLEVTFSLDAAELVSSVLLLITATAVLEIHLYCLMLLFFYSC